MASGKCFLDLPDELILKVFTELSNDDLALSVPYVNHHWKAVSLDESLWRKRVFKPDVKMTDKEMSRYLRNMPALKTLVLQRGIKRSVVNTLCQYCRDIRRIEFTWSQRLRNCTLNNIISKFPNITYFSVPFPKQDQLQFASLVGKFKKLTTLSFADSYIRTEQLVLTTIADDCESLININLSDCGFQDEDIRYFLEKKTDTLVSFSVNCYISTVTFKILTNCVKLEQLHYVNCNHDLPPSYLQLLSNLKFLKELAIQYFSENVCRNIPNIFTKKSLPELKKLIIYMCDRFEATELSVILINCPQLQELFIRTEGELDNAFQYVNNLVKLDLSTCALVTDKSIEYVSSKCYNLKYLDLSFCSLITDKSVEYLSKGCLKLENLIIQNCPEITDFGLENLLKFNYLIFISISWNSLIIGTFLKSIPSYLKNLSQMQIYGCTSINKVCLHELQIVMPTLQIHGLSDDESSDNDDMHLENSDLFTEIL